MHSSRRSKSRGLKISWSGTIFRNGNIMALWNYQRELTRVADWSREAGNKNG